MEMSLPLFRGEGKTFEARAWGVKHYNMTDHVGERVLLGRHVAMDAQKFQAGYREIQRDDGKMYPFHRLALHLCPPLARWIATGRMLVCSEEAVKFLVNSVGFPTKYKSGKGIAPWYLADAIRRWDDYEVVDDGVYGIEWIIQQPEPGSGSGTQAPGDMPTAGAPGGGDLVPGHVPTGGDHDPPAGDLPTLP